MVHVSSTEIVPIETLDISFEGTQSRQQCVTTITCTEVRGGGGGIMAS